MGIGEPEDNVTDPYERGMLVVPDCVAPNEGEVPVKQYNVATMYGTFVSAEGRLQVTNKRVLFRATGRAVLGRTTLHNEFAIDEIAGFEAARRNKFHFSLLVFGLLIAYIGAVVSVTITSFAIPDEWTEREPTEIHEQYQAPTGEWRTRTRTEMQERTRFQHTPEPMAFLMSDAHLERLGFAGILGFLIGVGGIVPFFMIKRKFLLKLLFLGGSFGGFAVLAASGSWAMLFLLVTGLLLAVCLFLCALTPQLVLSVKNKGAMPTVDIRNSSDPGFLASMIGLRGSDAGFAQVEPAAETENAIREIGAIINDIQKLGDYGINKWL
jgi:hypothetical protein